MGLLIFLKAAKKWVGQIQNEINSLKSAINSYTLGGQKLIDHYTNKLQKCKPRYRVESGGLCFDCITKLREEVAKEESLEKIQKELDALKNKILALTAGEQKLMEYFKKSLKQCTN